MGLIELNVPIANGFPVHHVLNTLFMKSEQLNFFLQC